ncbi:UNVERIFIED_CONTAM: cytochrome P450 [Euhalothece sp. KZN 001]
MEKNLPSLSTPPFLQTLELIANPIQFFDKYQNKYGDIFSARILGNQSPSVHFIGDPKALEAIFNAPSGQFQLGKITHVFRPFTGDRSLIMLDGEEHRRQRKLLIPPLHGKRMHFYQDVICELTEETIKTLSKNQSFSCRKLMAEITLKVILRVVFGLKPGKRSNDLQKLIADLLDAITNPLYSSLFFFPSLQIDLGKYSPWGHFIRKQSAIDALIYAEIKERRQQDNSQQTDILSLLLSATDEDGNTMSDQELRDQLITLLFLGHETTASSLAWMFYWVYSSPEVWEKLTTEIQALGNTPQPQELIQLPYLDAICKETLRLYPIALISQPRVVQETITINHTSFLPDSILVPCIYLAHHREENFANSKTFQPDRFLDNQFTAYQYFPFGGGSRACIGAAFSLYEMKLIFGTIFSQLSLKLASQKPIKPIRRGITIVPSGGVKLGFAEKVHVFGVVRQKARGKRQEG